MDPRLDYRVMVAHPQSMHQPAHDEIVATLHTHSEAMKMVHRLRAKGLSAYVKHMPAL